jgi:hypothetical protein
LPTTEATKSTLTMSDESLLPFDLPAVSRKMVSASFDGGAVSSDGGLLLREADRRLGLTRMLASCVQDRDRTAPLVQRALAAPCPS